MKRKTTKAIELMGRILVKVFHLSTKLSTNL